MALLRRPFRDLVARQLDIFEADHGDALGRIAEAREQAARASVDEAETAYGDYADLVDWAADDLRALRDGFAGTLEPARVDAYEDAFRRGVRRRFPALASAVEDG